MPELSVIGFDGVLGLSDDFAKQVSGVLRPGRSAPSVLADSGDPTGLAL